MKTISTEPSSPSGQPTRKQKEPERPKEVAPERIGAISAQAVAVEVPEPSLSIYTESHHIIPKEAITHVYLIRYAVDLGWDINKDSNRFDVDPRINKLAKDYFKYYKNQCTGIAKALDYRSDTYKGLFNEIANLNDRLNQENEQYSNQINEYYDKIEKLKKKEKENKKNIYKTGISNLPEDLQKQKKLFFNELDGLAKKILPILEKWIKAQVVILCKKEAKRAKARKK